MSIAAMNWAMKQRTDGPSAQIILFAIADRANEHGVCRHADPDTLAELTRQSRATVFRRLEELERAGTLCRFTRHLDDGRREYEIRLQTAVTVNYTVTKDRDVAHQDGDGNTISVVPYGDEPPDHEVQSHPETHPGSQIATHPVAPVRPPESQSCDPHKSPSKSPEGTPLPPKGGDGHSDGKAGESATPQSGSDTWPRFEAAYSEPILRQSLARHAWAGLADTERDLAIKAARGYVAWRRAQKKPPNVINAHTFLKEIDAWPGFAKHAPADPTLRLFVAEGSREFEAVSVIAQIGGWKLPMLVLDPASAKRGFWRNLPLTPDELALAQFAAKPPEQWTLLEPGTKPFYAWGDRLGQWFGRRPETIRVPCLFPPRKDGTFPPPPSQEESTGPPGETDAA